ncbi:MAG: hypothetical protein AABW68_04640 [archaeon]
MRTLSKVGWFCLAVAALLLLGGFTHYGGFTDAGLALGRVIGTLFWGAILWGGILLATMAVLFLQA